MAVERVVTVTFGVEALGKFKELLTGNDDDILLGIENYIAERIGTDDRDPNTDPMGVYVTDIRLPR